MTDLIKKISVCCLSLFSMFLITGCDYRFDIEIVNSTENEMTVKTCISKEDLSYYSYLKRYGHLLVGQIDTTQDVVQLTAKMAPGEALGIGHNVGTSPAIDSESFYCDFIEIQSRDKKITLQDKSKVVEYITSLPEGSSIGKYKVE